MNFSNYFNPCMPYAPFINMPFYRFPPITYLQSANVSAEIPSIEPESPKSHMVSKEVDKEKLLKSLKKFHYN